MLNWAECAPAVFESLLYNQESNLGRAEQEAGVTATCA
jgi:hypothetical protein